MAVLKTILHKKNSSGSYDDVYVRTRVDNILMTDNSTLLSSKLTSLDTSINSIQTSINNFSGMKCIIGTHIGTGVSTLTISHSDLDFSPKLFIYMATSESNTDSLVEDKYHKLYILIKGIPLAVYQSGNSYYTRWTATWGDNSISATGNYSGNNGYNMNENGLTYAYFIAG